MKKLFVMLLALMVLVSIVACDNQEPADDQNGTDEPKGITTNEVSYQKKGDADYQDALMKYQGQRGYVWLEDGILLILAGERPTGGYYLEVESILDVEGQLEVTVKEIEPKEDDMVTEAITYPHLILDIDSPLDRITVQNTAGETFEELMPMGNDAMGQTMLAVDESPFDYSKPITGIYQGLVDNHSIEILVEDIYVVVQRDDMEAFVEGIETGDEVVFTISVSPSDVLLLDTIEKTQE